MKINRSEIPHYNCTKVSVFDNKNSTNEIHIYPNPAEDFVYLNIDEPNTDIFLRLYDNTGKLILHNQVADKRINLERLGSGIYYLHIFDGGNNINYKEKLIIK